MNTLSLSAPEVHPNEFYLIETCSGAAGFTLHFMEVTDYQLVPYQGSKWSLRKKLAAVLAEQGLTTMVGLHLNDIGVWGTVWDLLRTSLEEVLAHVRKLEKEHPRVVYDRLHGSVVPSADDPEFAAQLLFLQRIAFNGKSVGVKKKKGESQWRWSSPGYNKNSAEGSTGPKFGTINPLVPSLIRRLENGWTPPKDWVTTRGSATELIADYELQGLTSGAIRIVFYLDPPYLASTSYPDGDMGRGQVVDVALRAAALGFLVVVSEAEPIDELVALGWTARCLKNPPGHSAPFRAKGAEWVTISPQMAA